MCTFSAGGFEGRILKPNMTEGSIESDLKAVQKKLDDIEKKQEMMNKLQQLERDRQEKTGRRPHNYEMM